MKYIIDTPEETVSEIVQNGTFLNPRDKERLQTAFRKRQPLDVVLQEIRQEIKQIEISGYIDSHTSFIRDGSCVKNIVLDIIDKHIKEFTDETDN